LSCGLELVRKGRWSRLWNAGRRRNTVSKGCVVGYWGATPEVLVFTGVRNKLRMCTQVDLLEKEKAAARAVQRSPETSGSLLR
jgi:hypothetical protein